MVDVELRLEESEVLVFLEHGTRLELLCPESDEPAKGYDTRSKSQTIIPVWFRLLRYPLEEPLPLNSRFQRCQCLPNNGPTESFLFRKFQLSISNRMHDSSTWYDSVGADHKRDGSHRRYLGRG